MKLEQSFEVEAPLEQVWEALVDVERVAPCLPGAAVTGRNEDGTYNGTFTIKIGPTTAAYTGKLEMQNLDESAHTATMHAQGSDKRGQGGATATIVSSLSGGSGSTRVEVVTDYHITGRLARFGRGGMIEDISERLLREFAGRLQSTLAGGGAPDEAPTAVHETVKPAAEEPPPTEVAAAAEAPAAEEPAAPEPAVAPEPAATPEPPSAPEPPPPPEPPQPPEPSPAAPAPAPGPEPPAAADEPASPPPRPGPEQAPPPPPRPGPEQAPPPPPPPGPSADSGEALDAGSLVGSVMLDRIKRNPKPVIAVAGGLLLLRMLRRRR